MRGQNPELYARVRIGAKWDALNAYYEKKGIDQEFNMLRKSLRETLKRFESIVTAAQLSAEHPDERTLVDRKRGVWKTIHGYNMNYSPVSH